MFALPYHNIPCAEGSPSHVQQQQQDDGDSLFRQRIGNMPYSVLPQYALPPLPSFTTALDPIMSTSQSYQAVDALSSVSSADSSEIYSPISPPKANSSNVHSPPPEATKSSNGSRFEIILNAAPAMLVKPEDPPLAYLNKGQFYNIQIQDKDKTDGLIFTTLLIMFHEEAHRAVARNYWSFWQSQQKDPQLARAVDIDVHRCNGVQNVTWSAFDRISFQWNGKHGASITVKFNCLSTDFSRIKGVKGIPLRLCMENQTQNSMEGVYCRIKLFRDKGAERKNKDDARHIERRLGKINTSKDNHPLWLAYNRTQPYTVLTAVPESNGSSSPTADSTPQTSPSSFSPSPSSSPCTSAPNNTLSLYQTTNPFPTTTQSSASLISCPITDTTPTLYCGVKRSRTSSSPSSSLAFAAEPPCPSQRFPFKVIDLDPSYVPNRKRRIAKLRLFVRLASDGDLHHAVYLEHLTAQDLVDKVTTKLNLVGVVKQTVRHIVRDDKIIPLLVDDEVVQHIPDEQPVQVETVTGGQDGSLTLVLKY